MPGGRGGAPWPINWPPSDRADPVATAPTTRGRRGGWPVGAVATPFRPLPRSDRARRVLLHGGGFPAYQERLAEVAGTGYHGFELG